MINRAPGGMQTATVDGGLKEHLIASQNPLGRFCGEARPMEPVENLWVTNSSPATAKRLGIAIKE